MSDYQYHKQASLEQMISQVNAMLDDMTTTAERMEQKAEAIERMVANGTLINTVEPFRMTEPQKRRRDARLAEIKPLLENRDAK